MKKGFGFDFIFMPFASLKNRCLWFRLNLKTYKNSEVTWSKDFLIWSKYWNMESVLSPYIETYCMDIILFSSRLTSFPQFLFQYDETRLTCSKFYLITYININMFHANAHSPYFVEISDWLPVTNLFTVVQCYFLKRSALH